MRSNRIILCRRCKQWRYRQARGLCKTCFRRAHRLGLLDWYPPLPRNRQLWVRRLERIEDYEWMRNRWQATRIARATPNEFYRHAARRLGVSVRTVERYERVVKERETVK